MKTVNCGNYFTEGRLNELCEVLEKEGAARVYIDCTGHSRNNWEQDTFREELLKRYGARLDVECVKGAYSYHYEYRLKN